MNQDLIETCTRLKHLLKVDVTVPPPHGLEWHPCLVLCSDRAVGFAFVLGGRDAIGLPALPTTSTVDLYNARQCFSWAKQNHTSGEEGVYALATLGPAPGSKLGPFVAKSTPNVVSRLTPILNPAALERWLSLGW